MRIGTWNMQGRWSDLHNSFISDRNCDVWLLTEVTPSVYLPGYFHHLTPDVMGRGQHWAGVYSRQPLQAQPNVHIATAAADVAGITYCSSILPWRGLEAGRRGWPGDSHAERTGKAVDQLMGRLLKRGMAWGGDWNHALFGPEQAGTKEGRGHICRAIARLELNVPTAHMPHRIAGLLSIDHIAVPASWTVRDARRLDATGLSDHDCYVVDVEVPAP